MSKEKYNPLSHVFARTITLGCLVIVLMALFSGDARANCDYSNAVNGWGWNAQTGQSCAPQTSNNNSNNNSSSNVSNPVGARISWNNVSGADRYHVQWQNNGGGWSSMPTVWNTTVDFYFSPNGVQLGSEFCVRVRAADYTEQWSGYSPVACINIPQAGSGGLNSPSGLRIELIE